MKIIQTNNFLKLSSDLKSYPGFKEPVKKNGPISIFDEESDSKNDIKKKWKRKKRQRSGIKLPYQK